MTDPIVIAIFACAAAALVHSLWPVITGNPAWLRDRRSGLAAACGSLVLVWACFVLHRPEPRIVERTVTGAPVIIQAKEPSIEFVAKCAAAMNELNRVRYE